MHCMMKLREVLSCSTMQVKHQQRQAETEELDLVGEEPSINIRHISRNTGVVSTQCFKKKIVMLNACEHCAQDYPKGIELYRNILQKLRGDPQFFNEILWTNEAFTATIYTTGE